MLAEKNPQIRKAVAVVKKLSEEERIRMLAESREKAQWDEYLRMTGARAEGKAEGITQGKAEGIQENQTEIVQAMRLKGFDEVVISEITKLSIEEIRKLG